MTKKITYRSATVDDCQGMLNLWRQFWSPQHYEANLPNKIEMDPKLVIVAEVEERIIGTIIGGFDGWWAWIYRVAVQNDYQGQGIASELFTRIHGRLKELGADGACLVSSLENESMQGLLKKLGYKRYSQAYFGHSL